MTEKPTTRVRRLHGASGRYTLAVTSARIEHRRTMLAISVGDIANVLEMQPSDWSKKVRRDGSTFTIEEVGRIADALRAPPGWPFISDEMTAAADKILGT